MDIVVGVLAPLLFILVATYVVVIWILKRRANRVRQRFPQAALVVPAANFFGQESRGTAQVRGNGTLILTDTELYFEQLVPRREFHIPLSSITAVETPRSHLGKSVGRPLLKVAYRDDEGNPDSIAWYVTNLDTVQSTLESALGEP